MCQSVVYVSVAMATDPTTPYDSPPSIFFPVFLRATQLTQLSTTFSIRIKAHNNNSSGIKRKNPTRKLNAKKTEKNNKFQFDHCFGIQKHYFGFMFDKFDEFSGKSLFT